MPRLKRSQKPTGTDSFQLLVRDPVTAVFATSEGESVCEHVPEPNQCFTAFSDTRARRRAVEWAASTGARNLAEKWADKPILDERYSQIRVEFITPDEDLADLVDVLDENLAWSVDGRFAPLLSQAIYVVEGVPYEGCGEPFTSAEQRRSVFDRIQAAVGLTFAQRRRLLERISETPIIDAC